MFCYDEIRKKGRIMTSKRAKKQINKITSEFARYDDFKLSMIKSEQKIIANTFQIYADKESQTQLVKNLESTFYSKIKTENIKKYFENFDSETVNINVARELIEAEQHVQEYRTDDGPFSKIANIFFKDTGQ